MPLFLGAAAAFQVSFDSSSCATAVEGRLGSWALKFWEQNAAAKEAYRPETKTQEPQLAYCRGNSLYLLIFLFRRGAVCFFFFF